MNVFSGRRAGSGRSIGTRLLILLFMVLILSAQSYLSASPNTAASPKDAIFSTDGSGQKTMMFLPQTLLKGTSLEHLGALGLDAGSSARIRENVLARKRTIDSGGPKCVHPNFGDVIPDGNSGEPKSPFQILEANPVVAAGRVQRLVPGITIGGEPSTLVEILISRVLKGEFDVHQGDRLTVLERLGKMTLDGVELCSETPDYRLPEVGEAIVIAGSLDGLNPGHLEASEATVLFVKKGIVDRGALQPEDWKPINLDELYRHLNPGAQR